MKGGKNTCFVRNVDRNYQREQSIVHTARSMVEAAPPPKPAETSLKQEEESMPEEVLSGTG